jgi:hypothetical protein
MENDSRLADLEYELERPLAIAVRPLSLRLYARTRRQLGALAGRASRKPGAALRLIADAAVVAWARFPNFDSFLEALRNLRPSDKADGGSLLSSDELREAISELPRDLC